MSRIRYPVTPIYVVGWFLEESYGGFDWFRSPFDAGMRYERELQSAEPGVIVWHDVVMVPMGLRGEDVMRFIDGQLVELEEQAKERGFFPVS